MKKPPRKSRSHRGSRKGASRKAARQARRESLRACDHYGSSAAQARHPIAERGFALAGLGLKHSALSAISGGTPASARRSSGSFGHALPVAMAPRAWARALDLAPVADREAVALLSLPLLALALMLALGLVELGHHRHPMFRGLEIASAARPAALPRTPALAVPTIGSVAAPLVGPVAGVEAIGLNRPPSALVRPLLAPLAVVETPPIQTLVTPAPRMASLVRAPIIAKSRRRAPEVALNERHPADLPTALVTPPFVSSPAVPVLASGSPAAMAEIAAASPIPHWPATPEPIAAAALSATAPVTGPTLISPALSPRIGAPPFAPVAEPAGTLPQSTGRLAMLAPESSVAEAMPLSPPLASLRARDKPGSGPELCTASPAVLRPRRQTLAPAAFGKALAEAALGQTADLVIYNDTYRHMSYPWGDVSALYGVCTDVVIRAYRALGVDLQQLVHESAMGGGDTSIEHRRVETLRRFFATYGESLPVTSVAEDYLPGDIVTYYRPQNRHSKAHIAVVSNEVGPSGRYRIIHNRGWGPQSEDALFVDEITGHYRYWNPATPRVPAVTATEARPVLPAVRLMRTTASRSLSDGAPTRGLGR